jgi:hypothetical protein
MNGYNEPRFFDQRPGPATSATMTLTEFAGNFPQRLPPVEFTNNTKSPVTADVFIGEATIHRTDGRTTWHPSWLLRLTWTPAETVLVPAEFSEALKGKQGSGAAPQLHREGDAVEAPPTRATTRLVDD